MISAYYLNFIIVVAVQSVFFVVHAVSVGHRKHLWSYLWRGMIVGVPFGMVFDVVVGHSFGMYNNLLGFGSLFLVINGLFSYGFMMANVMLLQHHHLYHMYAWSVGLGAVYEIANYFFPVWEWTFSIPMYEYAFVIGGAYFGLATLMMFVIRIVYRVEFKTLSLFM